MSEKASLSAEMNPWCETGSTPIRKSVGVSCIEPANWRLVWRARAPGGRGLILVDGHLVILGRDGDLVVVEATAEGYREKARRPALSGDSYTAPSFADGRVFVRDLREIACLRILTKER